MGPRHARLAHRPVPAALPRVERPLPRQRAALLGGRRAGPQPGPPGARPPGPRDAARGVAGPLRPPRPGPHRVGQLRRGPRRVHRRRPHVLRPQAQRGQRRGQLRRERRQRLLEPRRRGPHRRPGRGGDSRPHDPQPPGNAHALGRRPHAGRRRRDGPDAGGEQQRLLPGQRDQLARLGPRALAAGPPRDDPPPRARSTGAAGPSATVLGHGAPGARGRQPGPRVVRRRRHDDGPPVARPRCQGRPDVPRGRLARHRRGARRRQRRPGRGRGDPPRGTRCHGIPAALGQRVDPAEGRRRGARPGARHGARRRACGCTPRPPTADPPTRPEGSGSTISAGRRPRLARQRVAAARSAAHGERASSPPSTPVGSTTHDHHPVQADRLRAARPGHP